MSLWAEPGEGAHLCSGHQQEKAPGPGAAGVSRAGAVTLGEEVGLVLPAPHGKDAPDLIWGGRVEEQSLPGALGAKVRSRGGAGPRALTSPASGPGHAHPGPLGWQHWICSLREGRGARSQGAGPTLPVPSSSGLRSTPSKVTLGSGAPARAARVGSRSRELASSWVTPGGRGLCGHSIRHQGWGQGAGFPEQRA